MSFTEPVFLVSGGGGPISMAIDFLAKITKTVYLANTDKLEGGKYCSAIADRISGRGQGREGLYSAG